MPRPRKLVPMQEIIVFQQHQKGISVTEIAYTFKISASTVQRIVRKFKKDQNNLDEKTVENCHGYAHES